MRETPLNRADELDRRKPREAFASVRTRCLAIYVHRRRRTTSGIFHEELHRKCNVEDWELAAVFRASGEDIELDPKRPENSPWHLVVDGEKRTARQLLAGDLLDSRAVRRIWDSRRSNLDYFAVYLRRDDGTVVFETDLRRSFGRDLVFDLGAVFHRAGASAWIAYGRPHGLPSALQTDDEEWTAEQLLRGDVPASTGVAKVWSDAE
ncbi:MAG: hypothetical protein F4X13_08900 [Gammaproteobacteria bacterium]|nr:hypothetical protein [Gammaproteobacteria bacterium]